MTFLTLGQLIDALENVDQGEPVYFDFPLSAPTTIHSSRGYYNNAALGWAPTGYSGGYQAPTVADLLEELKEALTRIYEGWKGGEYAYSRATPLWVDNPGDWSSTGITEVDTSGYGVVLVTERENSW